MFLLNSIVSNHDPTIKFELRCIKQRPLKVELDAE